MRPFGLTYIDQLDSILIDRIESTRHVLQELMLIGRLLDPVFELPLLQDLDEGTQLRPIGQILHQILNVEADHFQMLVDPVLERVVLNVHPQVFVSFDLHALGGVALGRPRLHADLRDSQLVGCHREGDDRRTCPKECRTGPKGFPMF